MNEKEQWIKDTNEWALKVGDAIFNKEYYKLRQVLTDDTWKLIVSNLNITDPADKRFKMIPTKFLELAMLSNVREAMNEDGVKLAGLAAAVPGAIIGGGALAKPVLSLMFYHPGTFLAETIGGSIGGYAGGAATDAITRGVSDYDSFADMIASNSTIPELYAEMLNPGMLLGGIAGGLMGKGSYGAVKGAYQTFGPETDIVNRLKHPITTLRVGNMQGKLKEHLPKDLYDDFLNKLKSIKYKGGFDLAYNAIDNTIEGVFSPFNNNASLAHELGHVITLPQMDKGLPVKGYYYNISAPNTYNYSLSNPSSLSLNQNEFYSDLIAAKLGYKTSPFTLKIWSFLYPEAKSMKFRQRQVEPYIKELLFTNNPTEYKNAALSRPLNTLLNKERLDLYKHDFEKSMNAHNNYDNWYLFRFNLERFSKFIKDYGINELEALEFLENIGALLHLRKYNLTPTNIFEPKQYKQGGTINYLTLFK